MPFSLCRLTKTQLLALGLVTLVAITALAWNTYKTASARAGSPRAEQTTTASSPVKVISITVNPDGFSPSDVEVPEGLYLLDLNNRSGLPEINVQFGNLNNRKLKEVKPAKDKQGRELKMRDFRGLFNLDNGQYTITEANHPKWSLKLKVTAKPK